MIKFVKKAVAFVAACAMILSVAGTDKLSLDSEAAEQGEALICYSGHQQTYGDIASVCDGDSLGVTGQAKRLEAITISKGRGTENLNGEIQCQVHVQSYGDMGWVDSGNQAGTTGQAKRVEAIRLRLTGELAEQYDVYYSTHCQKLGWTKWTKGLEGTEANGGWCGTKGLGLRIEAIKIKLVPSGSGAPDDLGKYSFVQNSVSGDITYSGHQQTYGNLSAVTNGTTLGVTGQAKRLEGIRVSLPDNEELSGSIKYRAHVQSIGWQDWVSDGELAGTTGQAKRVEAVEITLTGDLAAVYDVWYRVHIQSYGWMGWAKNGQSAGSSGIAYRMEAIEIRLVSKAQNGPGNNSGYYTNTKKVTPHKNTGKMVALTFDDGPGARTGELLNVLEQYGAHATFFVVGTNASRRGSTIARAEAIGCEIGNHTYDHAKLTSLSTSAIQSEISRVDSIIQSNTGHKATLMRPPYGANNATVRSAVGKPLILWDIDTLDWKTRNAQKTINAVMSNVKDGDIILMHDSHSESIDAALKLVPMLINEGYQLVTVSELAAAKGVSLNNGSTYRYIR